MVCQIYLTELQLNKTNSSEMDSPFLDLILSISNGKILSKICDKRNDLNLVNFPFLGEVVPHSPSYSV